jgi:hypothetical protein
LKIGIKGDFFFFYCHTQGGKADLNNEEDIIDIILFLIFFAIENVLFKCVRYRRNREKIESERERETIRYLKTTRQSHT